MPALGAIQTALQCEPVTRVLGAANGIEGVLKERLFDMARRPGGTELLKYTPAPALGLKLLPDGGSRRG